MLQCCVYRAGRGRRKEDKDLLERSPDGALSSLGAGMLGWIERVVPQPPAPCLMEESPPAPVTEPAKVSRDPAGGAGAAGRCPLPLRPAPASGDALQLGGMGARARAPGLLGGSRGDAESLGLQPNFG